MVHTFFELMPAGSPSDFQRILDLKVQCKCSAAQRSGVGLGPGRVGWVGGWW